MKLKEQTARTYLKQVFQKTGMRRQTDLVSAVLKASPLLPGA
jgi:DNA-binding CsgD family transcriptional regulator